MIENWPNRVQRRRSTTIPWLLLWFIFTGGKMCCHCPKTPMKTILPERSEHMADRLAAITNVIRELVGDDLAMLVLFGSYARGDWVVDRYVEDNITYTYESDFDLLVVSEDRAACTMDGSSGSAMRSGGGCVGSGLTGQVPRSLSRTSST